jgi:hypothetical protein
MRVVRAPLARLHEEARALEARNPVLVVIGEVARLADRYGWFRSAGASTADPFADMPEPAGPRTPVNKRTA